MVCGTVMNRMLVLVYWLGVGSVISVANIVWQDAIHTWLNEL